MINKVVIVFAVEFRQTCIFNQLANLCYLRFTFNFFLLFTIERLVALLLLSHGFERCLTLRFIDFNRAFLLKAMLSFLIFSGLLNLFLVDQPRFKHLIA